MAEQDYAAALAGANQAIAPQPQNTAVCGHRLLAQHHGWNLGVMAALVGQHDQAGCGE